MSLSQPANQILNFIDLNKYYLTTMCLIVSRKFTGSCIRARSYYDEKLQTSFSTNFKYTIHGVYN